MVWTEGAERLLAFLFTLASLLIIGALVVTPYVLLFFLGKRIPQDGNAISFQIAGLAISSLSTIASVYGYYLALDAVHSAKGSTAALVFVAVPAYLFLANAVLYGALLVVHALASKSTHT